MAKQEMVAQGFDDPSVANEWRALWNMPGLPYGDGGPPPSDWRAVPVVPLDRLWGRRRPGTPVQRWTVVLQRLADGQVRPALWPRSATEMEQATRLWADWLGWLEVDGGPAWVLLDEPGLAEQVALGLQALGAETVVALPTETELICLAEAQCAPAVVVTSAYRALGLAEGSDGVARASERWRGLRYLLLTGGMSGSAAVRRRLAAAFPGAAVREIYRVPGLEVPVAAECPQGRWHWRTAAFGAAGPAPMVEWVPDANPVWGGEADVRRIMVTAAGAERAVPFLRVDTGDWVHGEPTKEACACGNPEPATAVGAWPLRQTPVVNGRRLPPQTLLDILLDEPAVEPTWEVAVRADRARGRDLITVTVPVAGNADGHRVREAIRRRLWQVTGMGVLVTAPTAAAEPAVDFRIRDWRRSGGQTSIAGQP